MAAIRPLLIFFLISIPVAFKAQNYFKVNTVPVTVDGNALEYPWEGGLNAPQFSDIDLDFDGIKDVFIFERSNNRALFFKRSAGKLLPFLPPKIKLPSGMNSWALLRDMDCDGLEDLVMYSDQGDVAVHKNISTPAQGIAFEEEGITLNAYYDFPAGSYTNTIYVSSVDLPSVSDIDHDGDMDILTYAFGGTTVEWYKNMSVENTGKCGYDYILTNECWGYFEEGITSNDITTGLKPCDNQVKNPQKSLKHSGSTLLTFDNDGDGIEDIFIGDISFQNLVYLNIKKSSTGGDSAVSQIYNFPTDANKVDVAIFPSAAYLDLTGDGVKDLVASPNSPTSIDNYHGIWLYKNNGTNSLPQFQLEHKGFLQDQMIDIGENTNVAATDVDNDGLTDLVLGSRGLNTGNGTYASALHYYKNTGTATHPAFDRVSTDLGAVSGLSLGNALSPTFGDLDADGKKDVIIGNLAGNLHWLTYNPSNPANFTLKASPLKDNAGNVIDVGDYSHPAITDINADGKPDLVVGERAGNVNYYQNIGTATAPVFKLVSDTLGHINSNAYDGDLGYSAPSAVKESGQLYLLVGSRQGKINKYKVGTDLAHFEWTGDLGGIYEGEKINAGQADLNGDGLADLVLGNQGGGVNLYYQSNPTGIGENLPDQFLEMYPNPAGNSLTINNPFEKSRLEFSNTLGQTVKIFTLEPGRHLLDIDELSEGLYFLKLTDGNRYLGGTLIVSRK